MERKIKDIEFGRTREADLYSAMTDVFVLSSHSEGVPLSVTEAMSAGLPVVASDVGAMKEIIEHRKDGFLVTYCAKGIIKQTLKLLGFEVEILEGPPGKREMIRANKK